MLERYWMPYTGSVPWSNIDQLVQISGAVLPILTGNARDGSACKPMCFTTELQSLPFVCIIFPVHRSITFVKREYVLASVNRKICACCSDPDTVDLERSG